MYKVEAELLIYLICAKVYCQYCFVEPGIVMNSYFLMVNITANHVKLLEVLPMTVKSLESFSIFSRAIISRSVALTREKSLDSEAASAKIL